MLKDKDHINYTAADIRRYVRGEMSANEMHAIEKAALDDPFLADAIEGMQQAVQEHGDAAVSQQQLELHTTFNERTAKKKQARVIALRWWQAAAAAVIVVGGALWIINYSKSDKVVSMQVAQKEEASENAHQAATAPAADSVATVQPVPETAYAKSITTTEKKQQPVTPHKPASTASQTARAKLDTIGLVAGNNTADPSLENRVEINDKRRESIKDALASRQNQVSTDEQLKRQAFGVKTEPAPAQAKKEEDLRNRETELITIAKNDKLAKAVVTNDKNLTGIVKGRVTDPFGGPVANAQVKFPNYNYNILTDKTGYFKLPTNDSIVDVSVNVTGYGTQNFRLQNNVSLNELQLQPANAMQEDAVTVIGYSSAAKKSKTHTTYPTLMLQDAEPVFGWIAYEQYLQNNKQLPANLPALKGNVVVSFIVNRKGELSNFKIVQSLNKSYDDEAIRLISQGPAWKLLKGRKARITVMVRY